MISASEEDFIKDHAYVPEHIPGYVQTISRGEPFLLKDYLCYQAEGFIIFVGYPLKNSFDENKMREILQSAIRRFKPVRVALLSRPVALQPGHPRQLDHYYRLDMTNLRIPSKVKNMVQRAGRELSIEMGGKFSEEHRGLIADFLASHPVDEGTRYIFERIPDYVESGSSAILFNARNPAGELAGFDVADFGARDWAFYMFNFRSSQSYVPGVSDLLLRSLIIETQRQGKSSLNLGLGINPKVAFFKKKWGGLPFLDHQFLVYRPSPPSLFGSLLQGFLKE